MPDALKRWFSEDFAAINGELLAQVRQWVAANDRTVYPAVYKLLAEADIGLEESIRSIGCPTLVMTGTHDILIPSENSRLLAERIRGSKLVLIEDAGHIFFVEQPDAASAALLGFIESIP